MPQFRKREWKLLFHKRANMGEVVPKQAQNRLESWCPSPS